MLIKEDDRKILMDEHVLFNNQNIIPYFLFNSLLLN
jgi:hypothetical protein